MKSIVSKPWGSYQVIEKGSNYLVKRIIVKSGGKLSLQNHEYRSEHWVIVCGIAEVTINDETFTLKSNENVFIPQKALHRLANKQKEELIVIEIWFGQSLDEDDITRYEDIYKRK